MSNKLIVPSIVVIIFFLTIGLIVFFNTNRNANDLSTNSQSSSQIQVNTSLVPPATTPPSNPPGLSEQTPTNIFSAASSSELDKFILPSELALRNTAQNCWSSLNGKVYDITAYIAKHPGGQGSITRACGQDLAQFSNSHPGGSFDSNRIQSILKDFEIGNLEQQGYD